MSLSIRIKNRTLSKIWTVILRYVVCPLDYDNGLVSGPIDRGNVRLYYSVFVQLLTNCLLTTGTVEAMVKEMSIRQGLVNDEIVDVMDRPGSVLEFIDISGRILQNTTMAQRIYVCNIAELPKGLVIIRATNRSGVLTEKMIIP